MTEVGENVFPEIIKTFISHLKISWIATVGVAA